MNNSKYKKYFSPRRMKYIKDNLEKDNEDSMILLNMRYYQRFASTIAIIMLIVLYFLFYYILDMGGLGIFLAMIIPLALLFGTYILLLKAKRKFYFANKDEIIKYVKEYK